MAKHGWTTGTTLENSVALMLHRFGLRPEDLIQQMRVGRFRLDFAAPDIQIAIEADGWYHRSPQGAAKDAERDAYLRLRGWVVLRVDDRYGSERMEEQVARAVRIMRQEWKGSRPQRPARETLRRAKPPQWGYHGPDADDDDMIAPTPEGH